jgi:hypothetical protein
MVAGSQPSPRYVVGPLIELSSVSVGVSLDWAASNSVPANGPESIVARTRNGEKSSSVPITKSLREEISD